jgi:branched-chain amino acid transport system ATP-binding protein
VGADQDCARELLEARGVTIDFSGLRAIDGVELVLNRGEILGLIGPNGAGKTTLMNIVTGFLSPDTGWVSLGGEDVTGMAPYRLARRGIGRTFQGGRLFAGLTALENVELGAMGAGMSAKQARHRAWSLLERLDLAAKAEVSAGALPYGDQRRLGMLRAVAGGPSFLLLDEPAAGLNEAETDDLLSAIEDVRSQDGCGVLVIEHDMRLIMTVCERVQVLDHGRSICVGTPETVRSDPAVIEAYLGSRSQRAHG